MADAKETKPKAAKVAAPKAKAEKPAAKVAKPKAPKAPKAPKEVVEKVRGRRKVRTGLVVSNKMEKTVVVKLVRRTQHPLYGKTVLKSEKFKAHVDESVLDGQKVDAGDTVEIVECRPISKDKNWRVTRIIEKVK